MKKVVLIAVLCGVTGFASAAFTATGLQLHLDAAGLTGYSDGDTVSAWADSSGNGNDAASPGTPTYIADALNGQAAVSITGSTDISGYNWTGQNQDYFALTNAVQNVKTLAMVFKRTSNVYYSWAPILGGVAGTNPFHGDAAYGTAYWNNWADPSVRYGDLKINGVSIGAGNAEYTSVPTEFHVMTLTVQDGWGTNVTISEIARSINYTDHSVYGMDIAELLVYDRFLSAAQVEQLTGHLGDKYGIAVVVPEPATLMLMGLGVCLLRRKK